MSFRESNDGLLDATESIHFFSGGVVDFFNPTKFLLYLGSQIFKLGSFTLRFEFIQLVKKDNRLEREAFNVFLKDEVALFQGMTAVLDV